MYQFANVLAQTKIADDQDIQAIQIWGFTLR